MASDSVILDNPSIYLTACMGHRHPSIIYAPLTEFSGGPVLASQIRQIRRNGCANICAYVSLNAPRDFSQCRDDEAALPLICPINCFRIQNYIYSIYRPSSFTFIFIYLHEYQGKSMHTHGIMNNE